MPKHRKLYRKPARPKLRPWFPSGRPAWVNMEPAKLGMVGGVLTAWLTLIVLFIRQGFNGPGDWSRVMLWVAAAFVISYAATGLLVWYILSVTQREFPEEEERRQYVDGVAPQMSQQTNEMPEAAPAKEADAASPSKESE